MTSLAEAYDRRAGEVSRERLFLGTGLFGAGALLVVAGILAATTGLLTGAGLSVWVAREVAGTLAGLGLPAVFVGVFAVLPASRVQRAAAAVGASLAVLGVMLFRYVYWEGWYGPEGMPTTLTLVVAAVYFAGAFVTFWAMFTAAATFTRRNDPGGTVTLEVSRDGHTHTVEVAESSLDDARRALGGVGVFGGVDDPGDAERPERAAVRESTDDESSDPAPRGAATPTDGGATTRDISSPLDDDGEVLSEGPDPGRNTDQYCGNCTHFEYVQTERGIQPYCGAHDELMDDMEACADWQPNR